MRCSIFGKVSRRDCKTLKSLLPASFPMKTRIWCCFAAGVDVAMLESEEKATKVERLEVELAFKYGPRLDRSFLIFRSGRSSPAPPPLALALIGQHQASGVKNRIRCIPRVACLTRGDKHKNELPSGTNPAHLAEQQNLGNRRVDA